MVAWALSVQQLLTPNLWAALVGYIAACGPPEAMCEVVCVHLFQARSSRARCPLDCYGEVLWGMSLFPALFACPPCTRCQVCVTWSAPWFQAAMFADRSAVTSAVLPAPTGAGPAGPILPRLRSAADEVSEPCQLMGVPAQRTLHTLVLGPGTCGVWQAGGLKQPS